VSVQALAPVSRETVAGITPGDAVELAIDSYEWSNPLNVVDADDPVKWDVRLGDDWWMRTIYLKARNAEYGVLYDDHGDEPRVVCHRVEDGDLGAVRGQVVRLKPVEEGDDLDEDAEVDPAAVRPDGLTEACVHSVAEHYDTLAGVADDFGVSIDEAETILEAHGCTDEVVADA
jgi:hypothetical protein